MAVTEMFSHELRYLVRSEITNCDGVGMYLKIMEHLNGQRGRDADVAREDFNSYKMNEQITFIQERSKFEEVFKTLEYAQKMKITESDKIQFITTRLINDRRVGMKEVILQSRINNFSYDKTVDLLVQINEEMSDKNKTVKMAGMFTPRAENQSSNKKSATPTNQIKYCYNFNESGECRFGASCIYSHNRDPNHVTWEPREKHFNLNTSKTPQKYVNKSNRTPNGGEKFNAGYKGKNAKVKFNKVNSLDDTTSFKSINVNNIDEISTSESLFSPFQSWYNLDQKPSAIANEFSNNLTMNMIKMKNLHKNDSQSDFSDDQIEPEVHIERSANFSNRYNTIKAIQVLQLQHSRRSKATPLQDLEAVHNLSPLMQMHFFHQTFLHLKYPNNVEYEDPEDQGGLISLFTGFKWNPRCSESGNVVEEIRNPGGSLMEMIYRMNESFMGATVVHTIPIAPESTAHAGNFDIGQYSNFRSMGSKENTPGYYKSTMPNLKAYLTILKTIKSETDEPNVETGDIYIGESTAQLMVWGVVYDFMSFCTYTYGENFEESETSIAESRIQLTAEISEYRPRDFHYSKLQSVFLSIARCANGILANTFIPKMINDPEEDSEDEYDINKSSLQSDDESDNENLPEPPNQKRQCNRLSIFRQNK